MIDVLYTKYHTYKNINNILMKKKPFFFHSKNVTIFFQKHKIVLIVAQETTIFYSKMNIKHITNVEI